MLIIYIDGDACPVKHETYRVAERCNIPVTLVSNTWMRIPDKEWLHLVVVENLPDAADDYIALNAGKGDIVITTDIPLASRCLKKGVLVLNAKGDEFTESNIGQALASREIMAELRLGGTITGGPAQFEKKDRTRFLQSLDRMIQRLRSKAI
jgi:uncharacterized protein